MDSALFAGKTAVVTGASTGIGLGLSRQLLAAGSHVFMSSRTPAHIAEAAESLGEFAGHFDAQVLDVRDEAAVGDYMGYVAGRGPIDYLFCNAGVGFSGLFSQTPRAAWDVVFDVDVFGVVNCVHHGLPSMLEAGAGHIVIVSSVAGISPLPYQSIYVAAKHAVYGFARSLRYELADTGVEVSVVCPGAVATNILSRGLDYKLYPDCPVPPDAIGIDEAGRQILEGIREEREVIWVNEDAHRIWNAVSSGDSEGLDEMMRKQAHYWQVTSGRVSGE